MKIAIDPPAKRSLNPNEQRVLGLLREGLEPLEIAHKLHMALQISNLANRHDIPPDTVMGLIASIREKGWDIPNYNKEDDNMSRGQKTPIEKVHEISVLKRRWQNTTADCRDDRRTRINRGKGLRAAGKSRNKKEPAPLKNGTSTKEIISTINIVPEIPADVNPCGEISNEDFAAKSRGDTDMEAHLANREKFFATKRGLPTVVWEAFMEKMENLREKIATAQ